MGGSGSSSCFRRRYMRLEQGNMRVESSFLFTYRLPDSLLRHKEIGHSALYAVNLAEAVVNPYKGTFNLTQAAIDSDETTIEPRKARVERDEATV